MNKINWNRVVLGGIVAGIVIDVFEGIANGLILASGWNDAMAALNRSAAMSAKQIAAFNLWGLAAGIVMVPIYAGIRPRFGAGPKTGMLAGAIVWALAYAAGNAAMVFLHLFPLGLMLSATAIGLVETLVAGAAGAAIYKEDEAGAASASRAAA